MPPASSPTFMSLSKGSRRAGGGTPAAMGRIPVPTPIERRPPLQPGGRPLVPLGSMAQAPGIQPPPALAQPPGASMAPGFTFQSPTPAGARSAPARSAPASPYRRA